MGWNISCAEVNMSPWVRTLRAENVKRPCSVHRGEHEQTCSNISVRYPLCGGMAWPGFYQCGAFVFNLIYLFGALRNYVSAQGPFLFGAGLTVVILLRSILGGLSLQSDVLTSRWILIVFRFLIHVGQEIGWENRLSTSWTSKVAGCRGTVSLFFQ